MTQKNKTNDKCLEKNHNKITASPDESHDKIYNNITKKQDKTNRSDSMTTNNNTDNGNIIATNDQLKEVFGDAGRKYGYDNVTAEFCAWRDFRCKWQRTYRWVDFKLSDYFQNAPREAVVAFAETLFLKIVGQEATYPEAVKDYVISPAFVRDHQPVYIRRTKRITKSPMGTHRCLTESFDRLVKQGLIGYDPEIYFTWTTEDLYKKPAYCSQLLKVVVVSGVFDDDLLPDYLLDFVVYHELVQINLSRDHFGADKAYITGEIVKNFPQYDEATRWLNKLGLYF